MKIPAGMESGDGCFVAQTVAAEFPEVYIGATQFRGDLSVHLKKEGLLRVCRFLKDDPRMAFDYPVHLSSVDHRGEAERFEVVYELFSISLKHPVRLKVRVSEADCRIDSVVSVWQGANFLEREVFDMMGIRFDGHPDLRRILLPDDYTEGFPLRKDFPVEGRGWRDTFEFLEK